MLKQYKWVEPGKGRKRFILRGRPAVDTLGLLLAVKVVAGSLSEKAGAKLLLTKIHPTRWMMKLCRRPVPTNLSRAFRPGMTGIQIRVGRRRLSRPVPTNLSRAFRPGMAGARVGQLGKEIIKVDLASGEVKRNDDITGFVVIPKRWVVERTAPAGRICLVIVQSAIVKRLRKTSPKQGKYDLVGHDSADAQTP